jgi:hypothetical protein
VTNKAVGAAIGAKAFIKKAFIKKVFINMLKKSFSRINSI